MDALWHLLNLGYVPVGLGLLTAALAKALWRHRLAHRSALGLCALTAAASLLVHLVVWSLAGREGTMLGYGAIVLACALTLWIAGWRRG